MPFDHTNVTGVFTYEFHDAEAMASVNDANLPRVKVVMVDMAEEEVEKVDVNPALFFCI